MVYGTFFFASPKEGHGNKSLHSLIWCHVSIGAGMSYRTAERLYAAGSSEMKRKQK